MRRLSDLYIILAAWSIVHGTLLQAQHSDLGGGTAQGDAHRGQAIFLRGMAWYELGTAQVNVLNQQAMESWNRSVQAGYEQHLLERARRVATRRSAINTRVEKAERALAETRLRWRERPTLEDVRSGVALNAITSELADPNIPVSSWKHAKVELPKDFALASLVFQFAGLPQSRRPMDLTPSVVGIGRMRLDEGWPVALRRPELRTGREAYERAIKALISRCAKGQPLLATEVDQVRDALVSLKDRTVGAVPAGRMLKQADEFLARLEVATRIFYEQEFAEELIRVVETHRANSIAELLAFMKKYRLLFSDGGDDPATWATYERLHALLKEQRLALVFADVPENLGGEGKARERRR